MATGEFVRNDALFFFSLLARKWTFIGNVNAMSMLSSYCHLDCVLYVDHTKRVSLPILPFFFFFILWIFHAHKDTFSAYSNWNSFTQPQKLLCCRKLHVQREKNRTHFLIDRSFINCNASFACTRTSSATVSHRWRS